MNKRAVRAFARRFREALERDGIVALERFDWSGGFFRLGFEMDCGRAFEETCGLRLGDARDAERGFPDVDDVAVFGSAIFSQCRYLTHWSNGYGECDADWLVAALRRLEGSVAALASNGKLGVGGGCSVDRWSAAPFGVQAFAPPALAG